MSAKAFRIIAEKGSRTWWVCLFANNATTLVMQGMMTDGQYAAFKAAMQGAEVIEQ